MTDTTDYLTRLFAELERIVDGGGTRHMISTSKNGALEIRLGGGDWYRISEGEIDNDDPIRAAQSIAQARWHWPDETTSRPASDYRRLEPNSSAK